RLGAGLLSGAMSAAAGAAGPAVSAYAVLTNWQQRSFPATLQPFLGAWTVSAVVLMVIVNGASRPHLQIGTWRPLARGLAAGAVSAVVMKVIVNGGAWPHLQIGTWIGLALVLAAGPIGGDWLSRRIDVGIARGGMLVLAFGGGIAALIKGAVALV